MSRIVVWGNNGAASLDPASDDLLIREPRDVTATIQCDKILWHSWTCTFGQSSQTGKGRAWGAAAPPDATTLNIPGWTKKILGCVAALGRDGVTLRGGVRLEKKWDDVALTEVGPCIGWKLGDGLRLFDTFEGMDGTGILLEHPLLSAAELFATESRIFVLVRTGLSTLLEVVTDRGGRHCEPHLHPIAGLEGLGIISVVPGWANRVGILTDTAQAFLLPARSQEIEELVVPDDVRLMGLGSKHEILVGEDAVWVRGESKLQLVLLSKTTMVNWVATPRAKTSSSWKL